MPFHYVLLYLQQQKKNKMERRISANFIGSNSGVLLYLFSLPATSSASFIAYKEITLKKSPTVCIHVKFFT